MSRRPPKLSMFLSLLVLAVTSVRPVRAATSTQQFQEWYPQFGWIFDNITHTNCTEQFARYITGYKNHSEIDRLGGGGIYTAITQPVVECILDHTSEYLKGTMASSQVLLGIMPTLLALLGPSHDEIAMLANVGRRPLLALGLAISCPSTYFSRAFEYSDPKEILSHHKNRHKQRCPEGRLWQLSVALVEYALTAGACFNSFNNGMQVGIMAVSSLSSDSVYLAVLWLALGVMIHAFSCFVFRLRLKGWRAEEKICLRESLAYEELVEERRNQPYPKSTGDHFRCFWDWLRDTWPRVKGISSKEFFPCASKQYDVRIVTFLETKLFLFVSWWESTLTILHIIFGTLIFSSLLFIGTKDALCIVGRYVAGVALCRVILMYELAGLREKCISIDGVEAPSRLG